MQSASSILDYELEMVCRALQAGLRGMYCHIMASVPALAPGLLQPTTKRVAAYYAGFKNVAGSAGSFDWCGEQAR